MHCTLNFQSLTRKSQQVGNDGQVEMYVQLSLFITIHDIHIECIKSQMLDGIRYTVILHTHTL